MSASENFKKLEEQIEKLKLDVAMKTQDHSNALKLGNIALDEIERYKMREELALDAAICGLNGTLSPEAACHAVAIALAPPLTEEERKCVIAQARELFPNLFKSRKD